MAATAYAPPRRYDRAWWRRTLRRAAPLVALLATAVAVAVVVTPRPESGLPLDPESPGPIGTRALVDVLRGVDREVSVVTPEEMSDAPVVLLLRDQLDDPQREALEDRIEQGARVVVADQNSPLVPDLVAMLPPLERRLERGCRVGALRDVRAIRPDGGALYEVPRGGQGCFDGDGAGADGEDLAWLTIEPRGRGHVIALGSPGLLANYNLGQADNAVLAVQLLAPDDSDRTEIVRPVLTGGAEQGDVLALVPDRVRAALVQVLIGFLVVIAWRARRLGAPLIDRAPVKLASSDLTAAVGVLLGRNDARTATQERIAGDTRRRLARRLGLPDTADVDLLIEHLAARTPLDADELAQVLRPPPPRSDAALLRAATALADLEQTVHTRLTSPLEEPDVR